MAPKLQPMGRGLLTRSDDVVPADNSNADAPELLQPGDTHHPARRLVQGRRTARTVAGTVAETVAGTVAETVAGTGTGTGTVEITVAGTVAGTGAETREETTVAGTGLTDDRRGDVEAPQLQGGNVPAAHQEVTSTSCWWRWMGGAGRSQGDSQDELWQMEAGIGSNLLEVKPGSTLQGRHIQDMANAGHNNMMIEVMSACLTLHHRSQ